MNLVLTDQGMEHSADGYSERFLNSDRSVYEVFRLIGGVALFLEDHFIRLQKSMEIKGIPFNFGFFEFRQNVAELVRLNQKADGNIKFVYALSGKDIHWAFTFISAHYPTPFEYQNGVPTDLLFDEREEPKAKVIQKLVRQRADQMIAEQKLFEVLLVDRNGLITEGSRTNVFLVKDEVFYTAPDSLVLAGITRQKVFGCLKELNFRVIEQAVHVSEIDRFDAVFLTGTSSKVLPVRSVGEQQFITQLPCVKKLMESYEGVIEQYIQHEKDKRNS